MSNHARRGYIEQVRLPMWQPPHQWREEDMKSYFDRSLVTGGNKVARAVVPPRPAYASTTTLPAGRGGRVRPVANGGCGMSEFMEFLAAMLAAILALTMIAALFALTFGAWAIGFVEMMRWVLQ